MDGPDLNELREEVAELGRRIDSQAALHLKTHAAVANLAESVGHVVARHKKRDRALHLNSFVAYVLFTALLGGAFFALYRSRAGSLVRERDAVMAEREELRDKASMLEEEVTARDVSSAAAYRFLKLLRDNNRSEAIAAYAEIQRERLTPAERDVFADGVKKARSEIVEAGYLSGIDAFRRNDYAKAIEELQSGLAYQQEGPQAAQMRYYLGVSQYKSEDYKDAAHNLELALAGGIDQVGVTDGRFYLAASLESLGRHGDARAEYDRFAATHPQNPLVFAARRKSVALARRAKPQH